MGRRTASPEVGARLSLRVLGSVCVEREGGRLELPPSKKTRALLGYLLIEGRALVARLEHEPEEALQAARKLVGLEPADERAHQRVMALLGRLDRPREAIAQYDSLREILRSTLGRNPSPETEHLRRSPGAPPP